jgi:hypothetical protein
VHRQHALVGKEILVADEEKAGDRISNSMNGEHTRLVLSHLRWMFGNIMATKYQQLAHILSMYFGLIYSSAKPSPQSRLACWLFGNLTFNLTNVLDCLATAKDKSTKKPVTQSIHFHLIAEEIPRFHEDCDIPLVRLLEEAGEAYQKVSKEAGLKRSDRKSDKVETMYIEEYMRERAVLEWGLRGRNPEKSKNSSLFAESVVPNLLIPSCVYGLDPVFLSTFAKLLVLLTHRQYAGPLLFVHLPPSCHGQTKPLPINQPRGCQCQCYCKCHGCSKDCLCKCPPGCPHCAEMESCRCKSEPVILALTGQGQGQTEFLHLRWCDEGREDDFCLEARVRQLLLSQDPELAQANAATYGQLLPLSDYWRDKSAVVIQAAYRMQLHKGLLEDAALERERLRRGKRDVFFRSFAYFCKTSCP